MQTDTTTTTTCRECGEVGTTSAMYRDASLLGLQYTCSLCVEG